MSRPEERNKECTVDQPGALDNELNEFWAGNPWRIFESENLSSYERNRMYLNVQGKNFLEVSHLSGADIDSDSRAVLATDTDNDGKLDLVLRQAGGGPLRIFANQFPHRSFLKVSLRGTKSNRLGIGARLTAWVGDQRFVRELFPLNSNQSQGPPWVHFGLGSSDRVDRLEIAWPSGETQEVSDLAINRHIVVAEGEAKVATIPPTAP